MPLLLKSKLMHLTTHNKTRTDNYYWMRDDERKNDRRVSTFTRRKYVL